MGNISIFGVLGGLIITIVFIGFVVLLLKIVRALTVEGIKNHKLPEENEEEENQDYSKEHGDDAPGAGDDGGAGGIASGHDHDDLEEDHNNDSDEEDYWTDMDVNSACALPSGAKPVESGDVTDTYLLRSSSGEMKGVYAANGLSMRIVYMTSLNPVVKNNDSRLFMMHSFDLKNFEPKRDEKAKHEHERKVRYVVFESAMLKGHFLHTDMSQEYTDYAVVLTNDKPAIKDTKSTDDRFFVMEEFDEKDGMKRYFLKHMVSDYILTMLSGVASARPGLKYMESGPSDVDLFFVEKLNVA
ncbi:hypothetical protein Pcinc_020669 [Petrolisthes cinctipes]|uniref:Uncharacterized protein n=1 Tax=Petrolisthes cinctipes TaxID=88211 RepID=A0AAE1KIT1_PETCI|nr:hypothetical protein Pcinc_020669 [Petrolisthes cinctipes]